MAKKKKTKSKDSASIFYRLEMWFSEGLVVASLLILITVIMFFIIARLQHQPDLSGLAPESETLAFGTVSALDYLKSADALPDESFLSTTAMQSNFTSLFGAPVEDLDWFGGNLGMILFENNEVLLLSTRNKKKSLAHFESLTESTEAEIELTMQKVGGTDIYSYSSTFPQKFAFFGNLLAVSTSMEAIELMAKTKSGELESVKDSADYRNVHSRLPFSSSAFIYVNLPEARMHLVQAFASMGIHEPGFLEPLLRVFPAFGMTISMEQDGWYMESFTAVSKDDLEDGLLRSEGKYQQNFLPYTPDHFLFEWGGDNILGEIERTEDLLNRTHGAASLIFNAALQSQTNTLFGEGTDLDEELKPLLDGEFWFGKGQDDFALMLELDEGEEALAYNLKDRFVLNYTLKKPVLREAKMLNGKTTMELQADVIPLRQEDLGYNGHLYSHILAGDESVAFTAIQSDMFLMTSTEEDLIETLNRLDGTGTLRHLSAISILLPGSEEIINLNISELPEENALKEITTGFSEFTTTRKIFDDGMFARHSLLFE